MYFTFNSRKQTNKQTFKQHTIIECSFSLSFQFISIHLPDLPQTLEKFTTRPRAFFTSGRNVLVTSIIPHRFTSAMCLKVSSGVHSMGRKQRIPALFTRPHSPDTRQSTKQAQRIN